MNKDEMDRCAFGFAIFVIVFWFMAIAMQVNGADWPGNPAWLLISYTRWILTGAAVLAGLVWGIPKWIEHSSVPLPA